jgi:RNA polymerase sigma factor (sigma-70 family)
MGLAPKVAEVKTGQSQWSDSRLVRACLRSDQAAWTALIDRYKNLIFSIPIKYGFSRDDAADIFQSVCIELLNGLPKLREVKALPKWIIQVTAHLCARHKRQLLNSDGAGTEEIEALVESPHGLPDGPLKEAEQEQALRQAMASLPPRCRELVHMLFFEARALPYAEVARRLGLAPGSIGFIRGRCLQKLRRAMAEAGYK